MLAFLIQKNKKLIYEFGKEMNFRTKQKGRKIDRGWELIKLLKSPAIMTSGVLKTIFLSSDPDELCSRIKTNVTRKTSWKILWYN